MAERPFQRLRRFLAELRRRNVYQVAATYAVVGFILIQVADLTFVRLGLPGWTVTFVIVLVAVGFPLAIVLAWAFERTPEGVRWTGEAEYTEEGPSAAVGDLSTGHKVLVGLGFVAAAVAGGWYLTGGGGESPEVTEGTVAVLPFQVSGSGAETWRDGMVTILSTGLDGAAGLRAIADRTVFAAWEEAGKQDISETRNRPLATARHVGAEYAVVGQAVQLDGELRLAADIHATETGERMGQVEVEGAADHVTALADSLTRRVLGVLLEQDAEKVTSVDLPSLTTSSLRALKAFLAGERHYRAGYYRKAIPAYERAVESDSSFGLAYARLAYSHGWVNPERAATYRQRAYQLSEQMPERERALIRASYLRHTERALAARDTLQRLVNRYPDDPTIWYGLAEIVFHGFFPPGWPGADNAFERAIDLEPDAAPYHHHFVELAFSYHHDSALAAQRIDAHPGGPRKQKYQLSSDLVFGTAKRRSEAFARLDSLGWENVSGISWTLLHPTDANLRNRVYQTLADRGGVQEGVPTGLKIFNRYLQGRIGEAVTISQKGELSSAGRENFYIILAAWLSLDFPVPDSVFRRHLNPASLESGVSMDRLVAAGIYLMERGRYNKLTSLLTRIRETAGEEGWSEYRVDKAVNFLTGYRAWKTGNPERANQLWADSAVFHHDFVPLWRGDLHRELGKLEKAKDWYVAAWRHPVAHERLGQLYEEMGEPEEAAAAYRRFIEAWENADPELQPRVEAARERLKQLAATEADTDE